MSNEIEIPKLAPRKRRQGAAANLDKANREPGADTPTTAPQSEPEPAATSKAKPSPQPGRKVAAAESGPRRRAAGKVQIAVDIPETLRGRARAAYRYASFHGDVNTFSDFVAAAIEDKVRATERAHNGGRPFPPEEANLKSGRPTGS